MVEQLVAGRRRRLNNKSMDISERAQASGDSVLSGACFSVVFC
jgi:hypothetical protein